MASWERATQEFVSELGRWPGASLDDLSWWQRLSNKEQDVIILVIVASVLIGVMFILRFYGSRTTPLLAKFNYLIIQPIRRKSSRAWSRFAVWWLAE